MTVADFRYVFPAAALGTPSLRFGVQLDYVGRPEWLLVKLILGCRRSGSRLSQLDH